MNKNKFELLGLCCVLIYSLVSACSQTYINYIEQSFNAIELTAYSFLIATLFFNLAYSRNFRPLVKKIKANLKNIIFINIASLFAWLTVFYSLKYIDPVVTISIILGLLPITVILVNSFIYRLTTPKPSDFIYGILIAIIVSLICAYTVHKDIVSAKYSIGIILVALSLCVISAIACAFSNIISKVLSKNNMSPGEILSSRFYLLVIVSFILMDHHHITIHASQASEWTKVLIVAGLAIIIPLFFLQLGIKLADPIAVSYVVAFVPVITFFIELLNPHIVFSSTMLILTALLSVMIVIPTAHKSLQAN